MDSKSMIESLKYNYCPICTKKMRDYSIELGEVLTDDCTNGCYSFDYGYDGPMDNLISCDFFTVFGEEITIKETHTEGEKLQLISLIQEKIAYWKENSRYLAEILSS